MAATEKITLNPDNIRGSMMNMTYSQKIKFDGYTIRRIVGGFIFEKQGKNSVFVSFSAVQGENFEH